MSPNITSSLTVRRANQLVISSVVSLDCEFSYETIFNWEVYDLHSQSREHPVLSRYGGSSEFLIKRGKLPTGIYLVRLTVKMAGTQVFGFSEGYIQVIESPLVAHISGGTKMERGFNKSLVFNASLSRDPDSFHPRHGKLVTLLLLRTKVGRAYLKEAIFLPISNFTLIIKLAPSDDTENISPKDDSWHKLIHTFPSFCLLSLLISLSFIHPLLVTFLAIKWNI